MRLALYARGNVHVRYQTATEQLNNTRSNDRRPIISALRQSITSERTSIPARLVPFLNKRCTLENGRRTIGARRRTTTAQRRPIAFTI